MPTILVIDDEAIIRRLVTSALKSLGITVVTVIDATEALAIIKEQAFDLVFVDINLPDMDGLTLMSHLKSSPNLVDVPLVTFTARNDPNDETRAYELGAAGFLYKPFSTQELRDLVTGLLGQS